MKKKCKRLFQIPKEITIKNLALDLKGNTLILYTRVESMNDSSRFDK